MTKVNYFVVPGSFITSYTYNLYTDLNPTEPFPYTDIWLAASSSAPGTAKRYKDISFIVLLRCF